MIAFRYQKKNKKHHHSLPKQMPINFINFASKNHMCFKSQSRFLKDGCVWKWGIAGIAPNKDQHALNCWIYHIAIFLIVKCDLPSWLTPKLPAEIWDLIGYDHRYVLFLGGMVFIPGGFLLMGTLTDDSWLGWGPVDSKPCPGGQWALVEQLLARLVPWRRLSGGEILRIFAGFFDWKNTHMRTMGLEYVPTFTPWPSYVGIYTNKIHGAYGMWL